MVRNRWLPRLVAALVLGTGVAGVVPAGFGAPPAEPERAEGRYPYLSPREGTNPLVARWIGLARAMPDWKDKAKAAHYRFPAGKEGRRCDQKDCHPGFRDTYVERLLGLGEGPERQSARERRQGLDRCGDCHTYRDIRQRTAACRLHFDQPERVGCTGCHLEGDKVLVAQGEAKTIVPRRVSPLRAWPSHELTREEKAMPCDRACHAPDNPYGVERVCAECHGKGKLEVARYTAPGVLVHATDPASFWPRLTNAFFVGLTVVVSGVLVVYVFLDAVRSRKPPRGGSGG